MDPIILTSRLKLTQVTKAERGSLEFEWLHAIHSNEKATWWSIYGKAKSFEDTEKVMRGYMPTLGPEGKTYRTVFAVHEFIRDENKSVETEPGLSDRGNVSSRFIGLVTLKSLDAGNLVLPENLSLPGLDPRSTLTLELAYQFLPQAWGKGYATETLNAFFESCKRSPSAWIPFTKLYVRAIVNELNPASLRVMEKAGMTRCGWYEWKGEPIFLAGEWRTRDCLCIFGRLLLL